MDMVLLALAFCAYAIAHALKNAPGAKTAARVAKHRVLRNTQALTKYGDRDRRVPRAAPSPSLEG
jgi:hypothetical protein